MLLVFDIGNTNITVGMYEGDKLKRTYRLTTKMRRTSDEYGFMITDFLNDANITSEDITQLRASRRFPWEMDVGVRLPHGEQRPRHEGQERVVFLTHFEREFGLAVSTFFHTFLEFFGLQPHHLGAGAIVQLSGFVTLCEGYLGVEPTIDLWARFFSLKQQGPSAGEFADCGAAVISKRSGADFPKIPLEDSAKKWQNSFFYVCNLGADHINLPPFAIALPWAKTN